MKKCVRTETLKSRSLFQCAGNTEDNHTKSEALPWTRSGSDRRKSCNILAQRSHAGPVIIQRDDGRVASVPVRQSV
jgi:hypothetical protein